ncbi:amidase family protein, partial [Acrocarpospora corrugata]
RIAVTTEPWSGVGVDGEVAAATIQAAGTLERLGHTVTTSRPELDWEDVLASTVMEGVAIGSLMLRAPRQPDPAALEAVSRELLRVAGEYTALDMMAGFDAQNRVTRSVAGFFTGHDLLVTPTLGQLPAPHGTLRYDDPGHTLRSWLDSLFEYGPFTMVFNVSGHPAISLPLGHSQSGLPIGVQLIAGYGREDLLFQVAAQLEQATPWKQRTPGFFVG